LRASVLLLIGYALFFLLRSTPPRIWVFLLLLIGITTLPFIVSDLLRGGILSIQGRYFIPVNIATIPVVAHLLSEKLSIPRTEASVRWYLITAILVAAQAGSAFNIWGAKTWWTKILSPNNPEIVSALNQASNPLLVVYGMAPTDLGDVLALSSMVDDDVKFRLYEEPAVVDVSGRFSDIYWYHKSYKVMTESGKGYQFSEAIPGILWRMAD
jgi:uncharacterized membrane protein